MNKHFPFLVLLLQFLNPAYAIDTWVSIKPSFTEISMTGFSKARNEMILSTEVSGKVEQVFVDVGEIVPSDKKIACLDSTFNQLDINTSINQIALYQVDINFYSKQVKRYRNLVRKKSVSISQLDDFKRQLNNAILQKKQHEINKQRLEEKQQRHCIKSPPGWQVIERYVEIGQWMDVGNPIAKVGNYAQLLVPLALSVNELKSLIQQTNLLVRLPEYNQSVPAIIERISPAFDDKSRKVQIDLLLEKNLPIYRGGLRVEIKLEIPDSNNTFLVSENVLDKRFEEVWVEKKGGSSIRVELLGHTENGLVRIASSELKPDDSLKIMKP